MPATLLEIQSLSTDETMLLKTEGAINLAAKDLIKNGAATAQDRAWAKYALYNPIPEAEKAWRFIVADNSSFTAAQILSAPDADIIAKVNSVVPALVKALAKE